MRALEELLNAVAGGDIDALGELYGRLRTPVYAAALAIVRDPAAAEEVLHDAFVRVYDRAEQYRPGSNPRAWIIAIARNLAYDRLRLERREAASDRLEEVAHHEGSVHAGVVAPESAAVDAVALAAALDCLDLADREIVLLRAVAGLAHREIASQLNMAEGTVRWRYRRALRRLAQLIEGEGK